MTKPSGLMAGHRPAQGVDSSSVKWAREQALDCARVLAPNLRKRSDDCINLRAVPPETIAEMKETGLLRLLQPKRFGGHELGWDIFCEVSEILAEACGSQGWVYRVLADHAQLIGIFPVEAQEELWSADPNKLASSSFAPVGIGVPVDGGFTYSGKHRFSSGIDHADWVICGGRIVSPEVLSGSGEANYFLVPKSSGRVIDDWFVNGLEGTGSKSFHVENVFVPKHRVLKWTQASEGSGPGSMVPGASAIYRLPRGGYTTTAFSALFVGMAKGIFSDWLDLMAKRQVEGKPAAQSQVMQLVAGQAAMEIDTAQSSYLNTIRTAMRRLEVKEALPSQEAICARASAAFATQLILAAVNRLHECMGSAAVYSGLKIEQQYRNVLVGAQQIGVNWQRSGSSLGAHLLLSHGAPLLRASAELYST